MTLDGIFIGKLAAELDSALAGAKIEKVNQPSRNEIVLSLRTLDGRRELYMGAGGVYLTEREYDRPLQPPMFCMLLRKHLVGARVTAVTQPNGDRILSLSLDAPGMFGEGEKRALTAELFGRIVNIILTDGEGVITDCLYRVGGLGEKRTVLPGMLYRLPEKPPFTPEASPLLEEYGKSGCAALSEFLDKWRGERFEEERRRQRTGDLVRRVKTLRDRVERRLASQRQELLETEKRDFYRECGDLITANIYRMKKGDRLLRAEDFYDPAGGEREIRLDPLKTPAENAAACYKSYTKLKNAVSHLTARIEAGEAELSYLESVLDELGRADTLREVTEIRDELEESGVIRPEGGKGRAKMRPEGPMVFTSGAGMTIRVGRNNLQNDRLTIKDSAKTDVWLHAEKLHGSHVVISCGGGAPDEVTLREAASLAAYYSQGREAGRVPVSYALIKHVKKPAGARPGMVIYTNYGTIMARPDGELAERLRKR